MNYPKINCIYLDWGNFGKCNKLPKTLGIFKKKCPELNNTQPRTCKLHKDFERNKLDFSAGGSSVPPPPPPLRTFKCYPWGDIETTDSRQDSYEWRCRLNYKGNN